MALTDASKQLFNRDPDERCENLQEMASRCLAKKQASTDQWKHPQEIRTVATGNGLGIVAGNDGFSLNSWSFGQLCRLAGVAADTVNKVSSETAHRIFQETLPRDGKKPLQLFRPFPRGFTWNLIGNKQRLLKSFFSGIMSTKQTFLTP